MSDDQKPLPIIKCFKDDVLYTSGSMRISSTVRQRAEKPDFTQLTLDFSETVYIQTKHFATASERYRAVVEHLEESQKNGTLKIFTPFPHIATVANTRKIAKPRLYKAPGHVVSGALRFILPKKVFERVVEQMILDARDEYNEALSLDRPRHAGWIGIRLHIMIAVALITKVATLPFEKLSQLMQRE
jgi:hypothetical protein